MGMDIETYHTRIGGSVLNNKMESDMLKKRQKSFSAKVWIAGLNIVILQVSPVQSSS
jgi:hypothetical protein